MTGVAATRLLDNLEKVKQTGANKWLARCPAHEDGNPSLAITEVTGRALVYCFAGCQTVDVMAAVGLTMPDLFDTPRELEYAYDNGRVAKRYYKDDGHKAFAQSGTENPPELYRLAQIRAAVAAGRDIYLAEGEEDVRALESFGVTATTTPQGAGNWDKADYGPLAGADVHIVADNDKAGLARAAGLAEYLPTIGVKVAGALTAANGLNDVGDHVAAGLALADLVEIHPLGVVPDKNTSSPSDHVVTDDAPSERRSAASTLVDLALEMFDLGISEDGDPFATPKSGASHIARRLRGGKQSLRAELANLYRKAQNKVPPQQALADALLVLEGIAQESEPTALHLRVAEAGGALWLDMGDTSGRVIRIGPDGWQIQTNAPVIFHRTALSAALPEPTRGGNLADLWQFLNVREADRPLLLAAMVATYIPDIPHPIPTFVGEQGTAKSTTARLLVGLLDPSPVPLRKPPRDSETWVTAASGSWVVAIDNVSTIPDWLSDSLCRAVTGDGDVRRALYTDGGLAVFAFRRCIMLTGIDLGGLRGDLAERLLMIGLERISDEERLEETKMMRQWDAARPAILGALLSLAGEVTRYTRNDYGPSQDDETSYARLKREDSSLRLESKPRMADFARVLVGVDKVLGTEGLKRYLDQGRDLAADTLTASPFTGLMLSTITNFEGTAAELLEDVTPTVQGWRVPRDWPRNARAVTTLLKRDAPALRKNGWQVDDLGTHNELNTTRWCLRHPEKVGIRDSSDSSNSSETPPNELDELTGDEYGPSKDGSRPRSEPTEPVKPTGAIGQKQVGATCPKHGTPTLNGLCGRCAAEAVAS